MQLLRDEPDFLLYGLWLGTIVSICAGLLFSGISGISAALNTATKTSRFLTKASGLYVWNILAGK